MEIIREENGIFLVRVRVHYFIVRHDPTNNRTYAAHRSDIVKGFEPRSAEGFTPEAVKRVAKARNINTGLSYYHEVLRGMKRADMLQHAKAAN